MASSFAFVSHTQVFGSDSASHSSSKLESHSRDKTHTHPTKLNCLILGEKKTLIILDSWVKEERLCPKSSLCLRTVLMATPTAGLRTAMGNERLDPIMCPIEPEMRWRHRKV